MNKELLEKYCSNCCTKEELNSVLVWFKESAGTSEGKSLLFKIWEELPYEDINLKTDFDFLLDRIHHEVNLSESNKLLLKADQNPVLFKRRSNFIRILTRAAAILMLPVLSFGMYMSFKYQSVNHGLSSVNQAYNEIFSSVDAITRVSLPDGTDVWLNHNSSLKYPAMFQGDSRTVELSGEGYFDVAHNPKIPFIVKSGKIQVVALGTVFNVMAYPEEDRIETSLINGIVELKRTETNGEVIPLLTMKPTDLAIFQKSNNEISTCTINDNRYFAWKEGKLVINNESIDQVAVKLSRWFNVDIQVKDPELRQITYTATFVNETLAQVMELLAMISPVSYSISTREVTGNGNFTKRKVVLSYRKK